MPRCLGIVLLRAEIGGFGDRGVSCAVHENQSKQSKQPRVDNSFRLEDLSAIKPAAVFNANV